MGQPQTFSREQIETLKASIRAEAQKKITEIKKTRSKEQQAIKRAAWQLKAKEAAQRKKADNHAKIVLGVAVIDLAQNDVALREKIETHVRQFYAQSPGRLDAALNALSLTVTKPESEAWRENV